MPKSADSWLYSLQGLSPLVHKMQMLQVQMISSSVNTPGLPLQLSSHELHLMNTHRQMVEHWGWQWQQPEPDSSSILLTASGCLLDKRMSTTDLQVRS